MTHPLIKIITSAVCAVIGGADNFVAIADFGEVKKEWLGNFLDLTSGIPSHDRFKQVLAAIKPEEFAECLLSWLAASRDVSEGKILAINGTALRRSFDDVSEKTALQMVSARRIVELGTDDVRTVNGHQPTLRNRSLCSRLVR